MAGLSDGQLVENSRNNVWREYRRAVIDISLMDESRV
jgi:hypothetical protein